MQSLSLVMVVYLISVLLRPLPQRNCSCYLHLMTLVVLCHRMLHALFFFLRSNTLDRLYPNIFVDFRLLIVPGNNKKITIITSFLIICTTHSLIRSVASSKPGPVIMSFTVNNIFISEGWLMNIFLSHVFPCTLKKKIVHF